MADIKPAGVPAALGAKRLRAAWTPRPYRWRGYFLPAALAFLVCGCSTVTADRPFETPSGTVDLYYASIMRNDAASFRSTFTKRSAEYLEKNEKAWSLVWGPAIATANRDFRYEILGQNVTGNSAVVVAKSYSRGMATGVVDWKLAKIKLVREFSGPAAAWKIATDFPERFNKEKTRVEAKAVQGCRLIYEALRKFYKTKKKYPQDLGALARLDYIGGRLASGFRGFYTYSYTCGEEGRTFVVVVRPMKNDYTRRYFFFDERGTLHAADDRLASAGDPEVPDWLTPPGGKAEK